MKAGHQPFVTGRDKGLGGKTKAKFAGLKENIDRKNKMVNIDDHFSPGELQLFSSTRFPAAYKKIKLLGRGGAALVYLASDQAGSKQYAIK